MEQCYGLGLFKYYNICCIYNNAKKKENNFEYDIIHIIFKRSDLEIYLIVLLPYYKHT